MSHRATRSAAESRRRLSRLAGALLSALAIADAVSAQRIQATVDRNQTTLGRPIELTVRTWDVAGARPRLPDLSAFRAQAGPVGQQVSLVNNKMSASLSYTYYLTAREPGEFVIGPVSLEVEGETLETEPIRIRVLADDEAPAAEDDRDTFVTVSISEERPYVGQQVVYVWRFYRRVQVADAQLEEMSFGDLVAENLGDVREFRTTENGVEYLVNEIRKALFPQRPGPVVIPPSVLSFQVAVRSRRSRSVFDFGRVAMEPRSLRSRPLELEVLPLPPAPPGFRGLVGDFDIDASLARAQVAVGESATFAVTVSGRGNVQMIGPPELPELQGFKVYDDKPSSRIERAEGGLSGSKTFRSALVPLQPGETEVAPLRLVYFDPAAEEFRVKTTTALTLDVVPGEGREDLMLTESVAPTTGKVAVKILADDILPLHRGLRSLRPGGLDGWRAPVAALGFALPPLAVFALWLWARRESRFAQDRGLRRRQGALRVARRTLRDLAEDAEARHDPEILIERCSRCLRHYVGDKLDLEGSSLTTAEVEAALRETAATDATVRRVRELFDRLDAAQYGAASDRNLQRDRIVKNLDQLVTTLDAELSARRGRR